MAVTQQVFILFLIVLTGVLCRRLGYLTDAAIRGLTQITVNIALPALAVVKLQIDFSREVFTGLVLSFVCASALMLLFLAIARVLLKKWPPARRAVLTHVFAFSNCGFMGYPVILSFNPDYLIYAIAFNASFNILCWTLGSALYAPAGEKLPWRRALLSPAVVASVLGVLLFTVQLRLPALVCEVLELLGSLTTPLSMLLIGARVCGLRPRDFAQTDYHLGAVLRLVAAPLITYALLRLLPLPEPVFVTTVLLMAMPAASTASMQAELYNGDSAFAARAVAYTTVLSLISIPLISLLLL